MSEENNKIGSACWYRTFDHPSRSWSEWMAGKLRAWSTDHVEGESGFGLYPVGVVENGSMRCVSVPVTEICFAELPPAEDETKERTI